MRTLSNYFQDYASYHRTRGNQRTHVIGIPMIVVSVLAWASHWVWIRSTFPDLPGSLLQMDFALLIIALASLWYLLLNARLAISFFPVLLAGYWVGRSLTPTLTWVFFVGGWILQLIGHGVFEKRSPAFTKNLEHLLIGPLWVFVKYFDLLV